MVMSKGITSRCQRSVFFVWPGVCVQYFTLSTVHLTAMFVDLWDCGRDQNSTLGRLPSCPSVHPAHKLECGGDKRRISSLSAPKREAKAVHLVPPAFVVIKKCTHPWDLLGGHLHQNSSSLPLIKRPALFLDAVPTRRIKLRRTQMCEWN